MIKVKLQYKLGGVLMKMKFNKLEKLMSVLLVMSLLVFVLIGCGTNQAVNDQSGDSNNKKTQEQVKVIRLGGGDYGYPSPYVHYPRGPGGFKMDLIFDSLLERDEEGLVPWLAKDYEVKNDGKQYLFTIRDGVKWQDGEPFTAEDVKFSFEYNNEHLMVWSQVAKDEVKKVELKGDNQVLITVVEPSVDLLYRLGRTRIIPEHIWKDVENPRQFTESEAVIGTGPYRLADYSKEHGTYRFEAFENFWGPKQRVEAIEFVPVSEKVMAFEEGKLDLTDIGTDLLSRYENNDDVKVVQAPGFWGYRLLFNMADNPKLQDKKLRQAISYALDLEEVVKKHARGAGVAGSAGILPPDHQMYDSEVNQYNQDLDKAKELLANLDYDRLNEEGIRYNEDGDQLRFTIVVRNRTVRLAEILKQQLAKVGIGLEVRSAERKTHDSRMKNKKYELAIYGHGGWGGDPNYLAERFLNTANREGGSNSAVGSPGYRNSELNQLLQNQKKEFNKDQRREMIFEIQEILAEDVPEIPLYHPADYTAYRPDKYDGWIYMYDHHSLTHAKLSYLKKD